MYGLKKALEHRKNLHAGCRRRNSDRGVNL